MTFSPRLIFDAERFTCHGNGMTITGLRAQLQFRRGRWRIIFPPIDVSAT